MNSNKPVDAIVQLCWKHSPDGKSYTIEVHPNYLSKSRDFYQGWYRWFVCQIETTIYYNYFWYEQQRYFEPMDNADRKELITRYHRREYKSVDLGDWNK